jgi:hypothetical protein
LEDPDRPADSLCVIHKFRVRTDEGLSVVVKGFIRPGEKLVNWYPDDPFNVKAMADAKTAARSRKAVDPNAYATNGVVLTGRKHNSYTLSSDEARQYVADVGPDSVAYGYGDASRKLHVTVIGTDDERKAVLKDFKDHPAFSDIREAFFVQDYAPGEWSVDPALGFQGGAPAIIVQTGKCEEDPKGGKVVYRVKDYSQGPEALAAAIRKANPSYDPSKDPGIIDVPNWLPLSLTQADYLIAFGAGLLVVVYVLPNRKE